MVELLIKVTLAQVVLANIALVLSIKYKKNYNVALKCLNVHSFFNVTTLLTVAVAGFMVW